MLQNMEGWSDLRYDPLRYLLGRRQAAWVKYRTLVRILGREVEDEETVFWRNRRDSSAVVARIRAKQAQDGSFPCMPWRHVHAFDFNRLLLMGYDLRDSTVCRAVESILEDQLSGGGYNPDLRTADGSDRPQRSEPGHWSPCMTGFVTKSLLDLGLEKDARVKALLDLLRRGQRDGGGWICRRSERRSPYCILGGTPWAFSALSSSGVYEWGAPEVTKAIGIFVRHQEKIIRHGYHRDLCYRCDEPLLLQALSALGFTRADRLVNDLSSSLVSKQQPDGSWTFRGKPSAWYSIEAVVALQSVDQI